MIGNDVVDLHLAKRESNWKREGFLDKVFTASEQNFIQSAHHDHLMVWLLWSMKEAAYKAHQRRFSLPRKLNWKDQQCEIAAMKSSAAKGFVKIGKELYSTSSELSSKMVHTIAWHHPQKKIFSECILGTSADSKKNLCERIACHQALNPNELSVQKQTEGIPVITSQGDFRFEFFSLSGHGSYSAYAMYLDS